MVGIFGAWGRAWKGLGGGAGVGGRLGGRCGVMQGYWWVGLGVWERQRAIVRGCGGYGVNDFSDYSVVVDVQGVGGGLEEFAESSVCVG